MPADQLPKTFDYIIVGSGSAGCVLAARLSEQTGIRVLLLEAGPYRRDITIDMPAALVANYRGSRYNWKLCSTPQPGLDGRAMPHARGRVVGGSSAINALCYMRGNRADFDGWHRAGAHGWDYAAALAYFKRNETHLSGGCDRFRGRSGPVATVKGESHSVVHDAFIDAALQSGLPFNPDVNGARQDGVGFFDMNVRDGRRDDAARAYLSPHLARANLDVRCGATARRVILEDQRAIGVEFTAAGNSHRAYADAEIILAAGAVHSPHLLMHSGIGPGRHLRDHGIEAVIDNPSVGANLHDHIKVHITYRTREPVSYSAYLRPHRACRAAYQWLTAKRGICTTTGLEVGAMVRTGADPLRPDLQIHFYPLLIDGWRPRLLSHGYSMALNQNIVSTGRVRLRSAEPTDTPLIDNRYFSEPDDMARFLRTIEIARDIGARPGFANLQSQEIGPGAGMRNRAELETFVRRSCTTAHHLSGTCRMGSDTEAVCDPDCRVRGVEGLRVVDASVMPFLTNANTNAPVMMIAERVADLVRGRQMLRDDAAANLNDDDTDARPARPRVTSTSLSPLGSAPPGAPTVPR